jgi:hypothetical protein
MGLVESLNKKNKDKEMQHLTALPLMEIFSNLKSQEYKV